LYSPQQFYMKPDSRADPWRLSGRGSWTTGQMVSSRQPSCYSAATCVACQERRAVEGPRCR